MKKIIMKNWLCMGIFCIVVIVAAFAIYNIIHVLLTQAGMETRLAQTLGRLFASTAVLITYAKLFDIRSFGLQNEKFFHGIATGGFLLVVITLNFLLSVMENQDYPRVMPSLYVIVIVIVEQLFVGIFEEFLFRGLILNILAAKLEQYHFWGRLSAILLSAVLFGIIHLLNLFDNPHLINAAITQVCYATFIGIYLGALYLRTSNIWVVVIYHALINLTGELPAVFYQLPKGAAVDISVSVAVQNILSNSIFIFAGLFLSRKLKPKDAKP